MTAVPHLTEVTGGKATETIIASEGLGMTFAEGSVVALDDINFEIAKGSFTSLIGPSGCGKSTLLRLVAGLIRPTSGGLSVMGATVTGPRPEIGMMFQKPTLLP
jgi:ABC-type nitrate/sulfonate/bicarbonate transport system, ATPase component